MLPRVCAIAVLVMAVSACSGGVDGPVIAGKWRGGGTDADVTGTVEIEGNCIYIRHDDHAVRHPVVWPRGTRWDAQASAIRLADKTLVYSGDTVSGGGGFHDAATIDRYTNAEGRALATACVDNPHDDVAVYNSDASITVSR